MNEHLYYKCSCNKYGCKFCDGDLKYCEICGGAERELTKHCCGYKLDEDTLNKIYIRKLNFIKGEWINYG